eukprot:gnl/Dysnectes_brevis/5868_a8720_225.p1 GENE.gnl/Dysnectes_brevis/5868_a8720_225~~gnl/Dysnectes_brevis/5868_a8720_225.p1  ORF type:complete len:699 (-),score=163.87 gnl/Dysnectes_brevis/5868_a8720_225:126-2009(-)
MNVLDLQSTKTSESVEVEPQNHFDINPATMMTSIPQLSSSNSSDTSDPEVIGSNSDPMPFTDPLSDIDIDIDISHHGAISGKSANGCYTSTMARSVQDISAFLEITQVIQEVLHDTSATKSESSPVSFSFQDKEISDVHESETSSHSQTDEGMHQDHQPIQGKGPPNHHFPAYPVTLSPSLTIGGALTDGSPSPARPGAKSGLLSPSLLSRSMSILQVRGEAPLSPIRPDVVAAARASGVKVQVAAAHRHADGNTRFLLKISLGDNHRDRPGNGAVRSLISQADLLLLANAMVKQEHTQNVVCPLPAADVFTALPLASQQAYASLFFRFSSQHRWLKHSPLLASVVNAADIETVATQEHPLLVSLHQMLSEAGMALESGDEEGKDKGTASTSSTSTPDVVMASQAEIRQLLTTAVSDLVTSIEKLGTAVSLLLGASSAASHAYRRFGSGVQAAGQVLRSVECGGKLESFYTGLGSLQMQRGMSECASSLAKVAQCAGFSVDALNAVTMPLDIAGKVMKQLDSTAKARSCLSQLHARTISRIADVRRKLGPSGLLGSFRRRSQEKHLRKKLDALRSGANKLEVLELMYREQLIYNAGAACDLLPELIGFSVHAFRDMKRTLLQHIANM